jgi:putative flippase GtrA
VRYAAASLASLAVGQTVLGVAYGVADMSAVVANAVSFVVATVFAYVVQRRWTWRRGGRSSVVGEILPFCLVALVGLGATTAAVQGAAGIARQLSPSRVVQALVLMAASTLTYGVLWALKFLYFDRMLFSAPWARPATRQPPGAEMSHVPRRSSRG